MDLFSTILNFIGIIVLAVGIVCVYDARKITNKFFSSSKVNESTRSIKIMGFIVSVIGGVLVLTFR